MEFLKPTRSRLYPAALGLLLGLGAAGCTEIVRVEQADRGEQADVDALLHEHLQQVPMVTVAEAYRVMLYLADGEDKYNSFAAREAALFERRIARREWKLERDRCIDRGSVAYMVCQILKIRGGVNYTLFGGRGIGERRYAVRELIYRDLMGPGAPYRFMAGAELVALLGKADRYMAEHGLYAEESVSIRQTIETGTAQTTRPAEPQEFGP